jgi:pimeloyl-ACP methyl ester carboxylesterase
VNRLQLLLLPGLLSDAFVWRAQCSDLAALADVQIADYRDCDSIEAMAQRVLATAPPEFAVAGHSMGGRVALEIQRVAGHRIRALALMDTATAPRADGEEVKRMRFVNLGFESGMAAVAREWLPPMVHPSRHADARFMAELGDMVQRFTPAQFAGQIRALLGRPDATPVLATISCPALVLCGRQDAWRSPEQHRAMAQGIAGANFVMVEECGHMAPVERPGPVTAALRALLDRA